MNDQTGRKNWVLGQHVEGDIRMSVHGQHDLTSVDILLYIPRTQLAQRLRELRVMDDDVKMLPHQSIERTVRCRRGQNSMRILWAGADGRVHLEALGNWDGMVCPTAVTVDRARFGAFIRELVVF